MPRKTDGIPFELHPSPLKDEDGKPQLYAQPVVQRRYDLEALAEFCAKKHYADPGQVLHIMNLLKDTAATLLKEGNRVETPFGSFAPKLKLKGKHTDPEKVKGRDVEYGGLEFIPSKDFLKKSDCSRNGFRMVKKSVGNSQMHDSKAMDEALHKCTKRGFTTIKTFMAFSGLKYQSAKRYLDSLSQGESPRLLRTKEGNTLFYSVNPQSKN